MKYSKLFSIIPVFLSLIFCINNLSIESYDCSITVNDIEIQVEVVYTTEGLANGLSNRDSLDDMHGMLFLFPEEDYRSFWMLNMKFSIDIIYIDKYGFIVDIKKNCKPCEDPDDCIPYDSSQKAQYVLEVNAGFTEKHNIQEGDRVIIN